MSPNSASSSPESASAVSRGHVFHCLLVATGIAAGIKWGHEDLVRTGVSLISALVIYPLLSLGLGLLILASGGRWILHGLKMLREWSKPGGFSLAAVAVLVFLGFGLDRGESPAPVYFLIALLLWFLLLQLTNVTAPGANKTPAVPVTDLLNRAYFAERIADLFRSGRAPHRIAILGPWGSGKSTLLKIIRERLPKENYRIVMVDPWKAKTPDEAWGILAGAFDEALRLPSLLPPRWARNPIVAWLAPLLPGIGEEVAKILGSEPSRSRDALLAKVNRAVVIEKAKVVILVDDMERAEADVVRSLFPVIDQLDEFENCHFVFAIDPDKIAEAYMERDKGERFNSQGFMDKVFDLQIPLPEARQEDVAKMLLARAEEQGVTPKFIAAFPTLRELIPTNPRAALHFYEDAKSKEIAFLGRYGATERNWEAFFAILLVEKEFPSFLEKVTKTDMRKLFSSSLFNLWEGEGERRAAAPQLLGKLKRPLRLKEGSAKWAQLERLLEKLVERVGQQDLDWAAAKYDKLQDLSAGERRELQIEWIASAGERAIEDMLRKCLPNLSNAGLRHADPDRCAQQLLEQELEAIREKTASALSPRAKNPEADLRDALGRVVRLRNHFSFARSTAATADLSFFNEALFAAWLQRMDGAPLDALASIGGDPARLREERAAFHLELASTFGVFRSVIWVIRELKNTLRDLPEDRMRNREEIESHCDRIRKAMYLQITPAFLALFRNGTIANRFPADFPEGWGIQSLYQPQIWLATESDDWKGLLRDLAVEAKENQAIANTCAIISRRLFLFPLWQRSRNDGGHEEWTTMHRLAKAFPDYVKFFWNAALALENSDEEMEKLLFFREKVLTAKDQNEEVAEFVETYFPLTLGETRCEPPRGVSSPPLP